MFERLFHLKENGSDIRTEVLAGFTTFLTMAYIIFLNPQILFETGIDPQSVFVATCLASAIGTALIGIFANYPIALAPGLGLGTYFTYSVCLKMNVPWQTALGIVFISGLILILITLFQLRSLLINAIPHCLRQGISAGIGLFLALIALKNSGIVTHSPATIVTLGNLHDHSAWLAMMGFFLIIVLEHYKVNGSIILSILFTSLLSIVFGYSKFNGLFSLPPSISPTLMKLDLAGALNTSYVSMIFIFFFVNLFDTTSTLIGVSHRVGLVNDKGELPCLNRTLMSDSGTVVLGSLLGTSSVTAFVESAAGTSVGGRTGLTALVVALLFLFALVLSPLSSAIPLYATAPALCYVAILMIKSLVEVSWQDLTEATPACITALIMPFSYSIGDGIACGFISYVLLKALTHQWGDLSISKWLIALLCLSKFILVN